MRLEIRDSILERLEELNSKLCKLARQQDRTLKLIKEIKRNMATQAEVDAIAAQLEGLKTAVAKIGSDLVAFIAANPTITVAELATKASEIGASLQAVDDLVPEQVVP